MTQAAHVEPAAPQAALVSLPSGTHTFPSQHPWGHVVALQMHWPAVASLDVSHAWVAAHAAQPTPPVPHSLLFSLAHGTHALPLQQPSGHEVGSQTHWPVVVLHSWPVTHVVQVEPAGPHSALVSLPSATHRLPSQHPPGHVDASQMHWPEVASLEVSQACPVVHAAQPAPPIPHSESLSLETAMHELPLQQPRHEVPPHVQAPAEHDSP